MKVLAVMLALSFCTVASAWGEQWFYANNRDEETANFPVQTYEHDGPIEIVKADMNCAIESRLVCESDVLLLVDAPPATVAGILADVGFWGSLRGASLGFESAATNKGRGLRELQFDLIGQMVVLGIVRPIWVRLLVLVDARNPQQIILTHRLVDSNAFETWDGRWLLDASRGDRGGVTTRATASYVLRSTPIAQTALVTRLAVSAVRVAGRELLRQEALNVETKFVEDFAAAIAKVIRNPKTPRKQLWDEITQQRVCQRRR